MKEFKRIITGLLAIMPLGFWAFIIFTNDKTDFFTLNSSKKEMIFIITLSALFLITIFFMISAIKHKQLDRNKKSLWCVMFGLGWGISFPIYWYLHIFMDAPEVEESDTSEETELEEIEVED